MEQTYEPMYIEPDLRHTVPGELANDSEAPYPSRALVVNPAVACGKAVERTSGDLLRVAESETGLRGRT